MSGFREHSEAERIAVVRHIYGDLAKYVHKLRIEKKVYIKDAAKHLGIRPSQVSDFEFGRAAVPEGYKEWLEAL